MLWNADMKTARKVARADSKGASKTGNREKNVAMDMAPLFRHITAAISAVGGITQVPSRDVYQNVLTLLGTDMGIRNMDTCKIPFIRNRRWPDNCELSEFHRREICIQKPKEEILRDGGKFWSKAVATSQCHRNRTTAYRHSLLSVWMEECQGRMDVLIVKQPKEFPQPWPEGCYASSNSYSEDSTTKAI